MITVLFVDFRDSETGMGCWPSWYLLLGQFSVTFEYRPGSQHTKADGMCRQSGQCQRPDCPVSATDSPRETDIMDQPFAASDPAHDVARPYAVWVKDSLEVSFDQHSGQAVQRQKRLYDQRAVRRLFVLGDWVMRYYPAGKKFKLDSIIVATLGWTVGIQ